MVPIVLFFLGFFLKKQITEVTSISTSKIFIWSVYLRQGDKNYSCNSIHGEIKFPT